MSRREVAVVGVAACAACCAGPILGALGGLGALGALGAVGGVLKGWVGIALAIVVWIGVAGLQRRRARAPMRCTDDPASTSTPIEVTRRH